MCHCSSTGRKGQGIGVSTESELWRRTFCCCSCQLLNSQPFGHEPGAFSTSCSGYLSGQAIPATFLDKLSRLPFWTSYPGYLTGQTIPATFLDKLFWLPFWTSCSGYLSGQAIPATFLHQLFRYLSRLLGLSEKRGSTVLHAQ